MQPPIKTSSSGSKLEVNEYIRALTSAGSVIQSLIDTSRDHESESLRSIPTLLKQTCQILLEAEARLHEQETKLKEAQRPIYGFDELQTLLDILPVGIIIAHDPQTKKMSINPAGLKILDLPPGTNPSKSAPGGDTLPFKVFRAGQEVPANELPMQYAANHNVAIGEIELEIRHDNGKLLNLIEYASPLYDDQKQVRGSLGVFVDITARKSIERRLLMQYQIARVLAESPNINNASAQILKMICETTGWEYGALWRVESNKLTNEGVWHKDDDMLAEFAESIRYSVFNEGQESLPGFILSGRQPAWLSSLEEFHSQDARQAQKAGLHTAFILPVHSGDRIIAILECLSNRNQVEDPGLTEMLNAVCNQVGIFLERKLLEEVLVNQARQQNLLAEAGIALSTSLDYEKRLQNILHLIVPELADWCAIDIIHEDNILERVAAAHVDPRKESLVYQLQPTRQLNFDQANDAQINTLLTGQSLLYTEIPPSLIKETVVDPEKLELVRQLNPGSFIVVPLIAHDRIFGLCTFVQADSRRQYLPSDMTLAEGIAQRVSLALDNAILYAESQKLNVELEHRVENRTNQLNIAIEHLKNQIRERQQAEEKVRDLNSELEQRITERTSQLELSNRQLHDEVSQREKTSENLNILLRRTRELYRISQAIGTVRTPNELLSVLLSSSYLKHASRASIAILEKPWIENEIPPESCFILAEWNRGVRQPRFISKRFTLEEYGIVLPIPYAQQILIQDIQSLQELPERVRKRFAALHTQSLIILPLIAGGEWYGLLSLHFKTNIVNNVDDLRHLRGLVNETAIVIKNIRLLETESQARQEAEKANDLKLKFLAMISHELRTPLASIKGFATTLLAEDVVWPADKQLDFLQTIDNESDKLSDLIEQLLDLSRMEAGILRIQPKKLSLHNVLDSSIAQLEAVTPEHELKLNIPPALPFIYGDEQRIAQVLTNLVGNAARYSPVGKQINISVFRSGEFIQIDVADQGPGIPPPERPLIFEAFRQLDNGTGNHTKGAGLGLAICKGLIEAHGGKIWVNDHPGSGTVMSFTLPVHLDKKK